MRLQLMYLKIANILKSGLGLNLSSASSYLCEFGTSFTLSKPQFLHVQNGDNNNSLKVWLYGF